MERRGCGLGCILAGLGLILSCFLLPYLISSLYSIVSSLLQVPTASSWLWGDWINEIAGSSEALYMVLAEGPICCVGAIALLIIVLGLVLVISSLGPGEETYDEQEYGFPEDLEDWEQNSI